MTLPDHSDQPAYDEPVLEEPVIAEPVTEPVSPTQPAPPFTSEPVGEAAPVTAEQPEESGQGAGGKVKAVALVAGAAALANKVRQEAPKKVQEIRHKRAAGRCVILTEINGRQVAIGPYRDEQAARQDTVKVDGIPHLVELLPQSAYFPPQDG